MRETGCGPTDGSVNGALTRRHCNDCIPRDAALRLGHSLYRRDSHRCRYILDAGAQLAGAGALLLPSAPALAADHRDLPSVSNDVASDITDIYMFRAPSDQTKLVMVMDTHPFSVPEEATSYHYEPGIFYQFNFTTRASVVPTASINFIFSPFENGTQTYTAFFPNNIRVRGTVTPATVTGTTPNAPIIATGANGIQVFAGPRDDPFFFDFVGFERFLAGTGGFTGTDAFAGFNVNAIVVQFPIDLVSGGATQFGAWGVTYFSPRPLRGPNGSVRLEQVDRMGNPAVNTVFIPAPLKDAYNFGIPQNDARDFAPTILQTPRRHQRRQHGNPRLGRGAGHAQIRCNEARRFPQRAQARRPGHRYHSEPGTQQADDRRHAGQRRAGPTDFPYLAPPHQAA